MGKLLYITVWNFHNAEQDGICKKILAQVESFEKLGFSVEFGYTANGKVYLEEAGEVRYLGKVPKMINVLAAPGIFAKKLRGKRYDAVYIRHCVVGFFYIRMLSVLRKICKKVVIEIPSYPYDAELKSDIRLRLASFFDKKMRGRMKKYTDRIVTYSDDDYIFGVPTIKTINGVDLSKIPVAYQEKTDNNINLIGVAALAPWHGFDRVISGMRIYYQGNPERKVIFHIVGDGTVLSEYRCMVKQWNLEPYVKFYGSQSGKRLNEIYAFADIAVVSLGLHRMGFFKGSTLKSREYGARGLPMISSHPIDYMPQNSRFVHIVSADELPVEIEKVVHFYDLLSEHDSREAIRKEIRSIAENRIDMVVTLKPVADFFVGN